MNDHQRTVERGLLTNALRFVTTTDTPFLASTIQHTLITSSREEFSLAETLHALNDTLNDFYVEIATANKDGGYDYKKVHLDARQKKAVNAVLELYVTARRA